MFIQVTTEEKGALKYKIKQLRGMLNFERLRNVQ